MRTGSLLAGTMFLLTSAQAEETPVATLEADMCDVFFFVELELADADGRPADRTLDLIYDTGASRTVIDPDAIQRASNIDVSDLDSVTIVDAKMGPLSVHRMPARLVQLDHLSISLGREIDGILSYNSFGNYMVTLDYENGQIHLSNGVLPTPDNETIFSTRGKDERPWIDVELNGRSKKLLVDSGSSGSVAVKRLRRFDTVDELVPTGSSTRLTRIETNYGGRLAGNLTFGDHIIDEPLLSSAGQSELFGGELMRHFRITMDFENRRQRWVPTGETTITSPPLRGLGVETKPTRDGFEVVRLLTDQTTVFEPGDVITHIGGRPTRERGCDLYSGQEDLDQVQVTRRRDGIDTELTAPIVTLID